MILRANDFPILHFVMRITRSIFQITCGAKLTLHGFKSISRLVPVVAFVAMTGLFAATSNQMFSRGYSVTAFAESISTFSADCATPKTEWDLGQTACAAVTGAIGERRIVWAAPDGNVADVSLSFSGTGSDTYTFLTSGPFAQYGTWKVLSIDNRGIGFAVATFLVRPQSTASVDLSILKFGPVEAVAGNSISYTIVLTNLGPDAAQGVVLSEPVPNNSTFASEAQNSGPAASCTNPNVGGTGTSTCTIPSLAANEEATFTFVYNVNPGTPVETVISNTASVSSSTNELFQSNNTASYQTAVVSTPPTPSCIINCPSSITQAASAGQCSAVVSYATPSASGACADPDTGIVPAVVCSPPSGSAFPVGTATVVCAVGGTICSFTVTVQSTDAPVQLTITCPANITTPESPSGSGFATVSYPAPTTTGNCVTVSCDPPSGSTFNVGITVVNCSATDSAKIPPNNTVNCAFTVTVTSGACSPATLCLGNITTRNDPGQCGAVVDFPIPPDSCGTVTCSPASGSFFPVGPATTVTCTSSTGTTCTFNVTVEDVQDPTINCPADIVVTLSLNTTATSMTVTYTTPTASDNCPGVATVTCTPQSGSTFLVGATTVICSVTDAAANTSSCAFDVTVLYNFAGFFSPVGNPPVLNTVNAGRAIPVKFSLSGNKGLNIFASGFPVSGEIPCDLSAPPSEVTETLTASDSSLTYDAASDQYIYIWKTDASWAGTCRQLNVRLNDGSEHIANFKFR